MTQKTEIFEFKYRSHVLSYKDFQCFPVLIQMLAKGKKKQYKGGKHDCKHLGQTFFRRFEYKRANHIITKALLQLGFTSITVSFAAR